MQFSDYLTHVNVQISERDRSCDASVQISRRRERGEIPLYAALEVIYSFSPRKMPKQLLEKIVRLR